MGRHPSLADALSHDRYLVRAKVFDLLSQKFHVYDDAETLVMFCKMKKFKLKEDIELFASEEQTVPLMRIKARSIIDFSATYDVIDLTAAGGVVGSLRRKGMKSLLRDSWEMVDAQGRLVATIIEDSTMKALLRRFVDAAAMFMPQKYHGESGDQRLFDMTQNFNPFVKKLQCDFTADTGRQIDRRLGMAAAILLMAIEGKQG